MVGTVRYRVGQFLQALTARRSVANLADRIERAMRVLTPEARALFARQAAQDQRHALAVYEALRRSGHTNAHLLAAALLHDVGKAAARLPAWGRAMVVLLERFSPRSLDRMIHEEPRGSVPSPSKGWQHHLVNYARHPEIGARWAEEANCSPLIVALIRRHEDRPKNCETEEDRLLAALQAADREN